MYHCTLHWRLALQTHVNGKYTDQWYFIFVIWKWNGTDIVFFAIMYDNLYCI